MHIPRINSVMTPFPYSVEARAGIDTALAMMGKHRIRHLPVMDGGELVGVTSRYALESKLARQDGSSAVRDAALDEAYIVEIGEPLERVLLQLAERHLECALVVKDGRLAGIFTMIDACRHFAKELERQRKQGGDDAA